MKKSKDVPQQKMLNLEAVASLFCVDPRTINGWVARGTFPPPMRFTRRCLRWTEDEIQAFIESKRPAKADK